MDNSRNLVLEQIVLFDSVPAASPSSVIPFWLLLFLWWLYNASRQHEAASAALHLLLSDDKWILLIPGAKCFLQNVTVCEYFLLQCPGRGAEGGILRRSKVAFLPSVLYKAGLSVVDSCNLVWLLLLVPPSLGFCNCTWAWATFCLSRLLLFKLSFSHVCDSSDLSVS